METLLYWLARGLLGWIRVLPLDWLARLGRLGGGVAWHLDRRHRQVALENITAALGADLDARQCRAMAREHFKRLGETYACGLKCTGMTWEALSPRVAWVGMDRVFQPGVERVILATGHFGNFELLAFGGQVVPGWNVATTYRALRPERLDQLFLESRQRTGAIYIERRGGIPALREVMKRTPIALGILADQHAGDRGLWLPFLGRECSCTSAPALFALRYHAVLTTLICFRTGLARWRVEVGGPISTREPDGTARSVEAVTVDINRAFEEAIRRDPANWFWVHRRWKPRV